MKNILFKILQWIISLISWLTLSPLFYYLTWKWKLIGKKLRVTLLLISPIFLQDIYLSLQKQFRKEIYEEDNE